MLVLLGMKQGGKEEREWGITFCRTQPRGEKSMNEAL